jgi:hypothetical protein
MRGERGGSYGVLVGKPRRKRILGRPKLTWENSIEADLYEIGWGRSLILLSIGTIGGLL